MQTIIALNPWSHYTTHAIIPNAAVTAAQNGDLQQLMNTQFALHVKYLKRIETQKKSNNIVKVINHVLKHRYLLWNIILYALVICCC